MGLNSFDFSGADWNNPNPKDIRYWQALILAVMERLRAVETRRTSGAGYNYFDEPLDFAIKNGHPSSLVTDISEKLDALKGYYIAGDFNDWKESVKTEGEFPTFKDDDFLLEELEGCDYKNTVPPVYSNSEDWKDYLKACKNAVCKLRYLEMNNVYSKGYSVVAEASGETEIKYAYTRETVPTDYKGDPIENLLTLSNEWNVWKDSDWSSVVSGIRSGYNLIQNGTNFTRNLGYDYCWDYVFDDNDRCIGANIFTNGQHADASVEPSEGHSEIETMNSRLGFGSSFSESNKTKKASVTYNFSNYQFRLPFTGNKYIQYNDKAQEQVYKSYKYIHYPVEWGWYDTCAVHYNALPRCKSVWSTIYAELERVTDINTINNLTCTVKHYRYRDDYCADGKYFDGWGNEVEEGEPYYNHFEEETRTFGNIQYDHYTYGSYVLDFNNNLITNKYRYSGYSFFYTVVEIPEFNVKYRYSPHWLSGYKEEYAEETYPLGSRIPSKFEYRYETFSSLKKLNYRFDGGVCIIKGDGDEEWASEDIFSINIQFNHIYSDTWFKDTLKGILESNEYIFDDIVSTERYGVEDVYCRVIKKDEDNSLYYWQYKYKPIGFKFYPLGYGSYKKELTYQQIIDNINADKYWEYRDFIKICPGAKWDIGKNYLSEYYNFKEFNIPDEVEVPLRNLMLGNANVTGTQGASTGEYPWSSIKCAMTRYSSIDDFPTYSEKVENPDVLQDTSNLGFDGNIYKLQVCVTSTNGSEDDGVYEHEILGKASESPKCTIPRLSDIPELPTLNSSIVKEYFPRFIIDLNISGGFNFR